MENETDLLGKKLLHLGSKDTSDDHSVSNLQKELRRIGVLQNNDIVIDGFFDQATNVAVRRLQWFAANVSGALKSDGSFISRQKTFLTLDGFVGPKVKSFIQDLKDKNLSATGRLVTVCFADLPTFSRINPNVNFQPLFNNNKNYGLCDIDFANTLVEMNKIASEVNVYIFINQLFRVEGSNVSGAVVPPATTSAHKIGRAVDLQLGGDYSTPQPSISIKNAISGSSFYKFREKVKSNLHCRYGGDFSQSDPPHFDQQVQPSGHEIWKCYYFFNQLQYRQSLTNANAIPSF